MAFLCLGSSGKALGQVYLNSTGYTQNFDNLESGMPEGWQFVRLAGTGTNPLTLGVTNGSTATGGVYNVGTSGAADRALGTLASGGAIPAVGVSFRNTTGTTLNGFRIDATMEQWRTHSSNTVVEKVIFEYSTDATSLTTGTWVGVESLDLVEILTTTTAAAAVNGNDAANRTAITGDITASLAPDAIIWIRWRDQDAAGSDGLYAIDDFSAKLVTADITAPTLVSSTPADGATNVETVTNLVLSFSEAVELGTGNVSLTWNGGTMSKTISGSDIQIEGSIVTVKTGELLAKTTYSVVVDHAAIKDAAGNFFAGVTGTALSFTTAAAPTPVLSSTAEALSFPFTALGKNRVMSYDLSGVNVVENVTVSVTGPFQISKTTADFTTSMTFTAAELAAAQKVYVLFAPSEAGRFAGTVTNATEGGQDLTLNLTGVSGDPYNQNFNDVAFLTNSGWSRFNVSGAQQWASTNFGRDCLSGCNAATLNKAVQINGFAGGISVPNEDWLISPELDLASFANMAVLDFWTISAFSGDQLRLMYSADYTGTGNPNAATWTEVPGVFPAANSNLWTLSQGIELPKTAKYVAFVYTTTTGASRWTVDDFRIQDVSSYNTIPTTTLAFGEAASGSHSEAQSFTFRAVGYGNITLTASTGFELSADNGATFASSVVVSESETVAAAGKTVQVRFTPASRQVIVEGTIAITGTDLSTETIKLKGSSYLKSETFDVATYNMEFFGNGGQIAGGFGPANGALQIANATTVVNRLNMDIIGLQEISNEAAVDQVIASLPGYAKQISQVYSYSIKPNSSTQPFPAQKVGFIYNTANVTPVGFRVIFEDLYRKAVAGATTLVDDDFWSSGRLPYMGTFDVNVNGITKRINVITIHAKSGSSNADYNRRVADLQALKDTIDTYYADQNVILLGDFNDNVVGSINTSGVSSYSSFVSDVEDFKTLTYTLAQNGGFSFPSSGSFLDHIIISDELTDEYLEPSTTIEDPRSYVINYSNTTSDHLPVYARFAFTSIDPTGTKKDEKDKFRVYPNPTIGNVSLQLPVLASRDNLSIMVYSHRGELVLQASGLEQTLNQRLSEKMSTALPGMYLVKVQVGDKTYETRLIKK
ncbi:Ig-like domain-containing protein [Rufibacter tibetensis]|uniref:Uncharacterized protein n=1 Tax=Rufibacter tibetensis TaxID=512763 RepID=A0A0P0C0N4_9BACT|nr:Ig-like domain-containing protein [Rufibacter tibetensis]ALI98055.1 hypothetical protein DC20_02530 [Rufibacter tibetensis]